MLKHLITLFGLGDAGSHVGIICDASGQTFMLQHWADEKTSGHIPIGQVVKKLTHDNARAAHLFDRGVIAAGYRADLNVIDLDRLKLHLPEMRYDLPLGSGRLEQRADGYEATLVAGEVTYRNGEPTGRLPGRLIRGAQEAPQLSV